VVVLYGVELSYAAVLMSHSNRLLFELSLRGVVRSFWPVVASLCLLWCPVWALFLFLIGMKTVTENLVYRGSFSRFYRCFKENGNDNGNRRNGNDNGKKNTETITKTILPLSDRFRVLSYFPGNFRRYFTGKPSCPTGTPILPISHRAPKAQLGPSPLQSNKYSNHPSPHPRRPEP